MHLPWRAKWQQLQLAKLSEEDVSVHSAENLLLKHFYIIKVEVAVKIHIYITERR